MSFCCGSSNNKIGRQMAQFAKEPPELEDFQHGGRLDKGLADRLSQMVAPTHMERTEANVNFDAHHAASQTPRLRRMSSVGPRPVANGHAPAESMSSIDEVRPAEGDVPMEDIQERLQRMPTSQALRWSESRRGLETAINAEKAEDDRHWDNDLLADETRLSKRLEKLKLDMHVVKGDGNCQFRAVSFALYGTEDWFKQVREKAVKHMKENRADYEAFVGEDLDTYLTHMFRSGCWGDELTLRAITDEYGIILNVLTSDQHHWFMRYKPKELKSPQEAWITYIAPVHYNAIRRRSSTTGFKRRLSRSNSQIQQALDTARSSGLQSSGLQSPREMQLEPIPSPPASPQPVSVA